MKTTKSGEVWDRMEEGGLHFVNRCLLQKSFFALDFEGPHGEQSLPYLHLFFSGVGSWVPPGDFPKGKGRGAPILRQNRMQIGQYNSLQGRKGSFLIRCLEGHTL